MSLGVFPLICFKPFIFRLTASCQATAAGSVSSASDEVSPLPTKPTAAPKGTPADPKRPSVQVLEWVTGPQAHRHIHSNVHMTVTPPSKEV